MITDTSQYYWGLQYTFQVPVGRDSSYMVAYKMYLAGAASGQILGVTGVKEEGEGFLPATYTLGQNYPNPFNPPLRLPSRSRHRAA